MPNGVRYGQWFQNLLEPLHSLSLSLHIIQYSYSTMISPGAKPPKAEPPKAATCSQYAHSTRHVTPYSLTYPVRLYRLTYLVTPYSLTHTLSDIPCHAVLSDIPCHALQSDIPCHAVQSSYPVTLYSLTVFPVYYNMILILVITTAAPRVD